MARTRSCYYLCEELIIKILLLLPVLSLVRFRSVCKLWHSIICDPQFIETHLADSKKKLASTMSVARVFSGNKDCSTLNNVYMETREDSVRVHHAPHCQRTSRFSGYCNGLISLSKEDSDAVCLWNPSTKRYKILPTPRKQSNCGRYLIGFGFDPVSNDYKFLRIVFKIFRRFGHVTCMSEAEVYSANADSWKEIQFSKTMQFQHMLPKMMMMMRYSPCFHAKTGVLLFEGVDKLLLFDLHSEVLAVFPYPGSVQHKRRSQVLDFKGSVAMVFESAGDGPVLSLWTLDAVCGKVSWTKKFNLDANFEIKSVLLYLGAGQFVVLDGAAEYIVYDYKTKENKKFTFPTHSTDIMSLVKYTESLVSLKGFKQQECCGKRKKERTMFTYDGEKLLNFANY